ncbi:peptidoglycan-binding domain-containing protein [Haloglycomyces albus]|uniref:peptidoglycan-binding domain-containing protein n=1 Tax=Haloglycomyces albus TaxID=526067 RepID=UPI0004ACF9B1|nr:peptidoglycan-binding protein [Haloglycomyces albus]
MGWRLAASLDRLRAEIDALAPHRSRRSDGTIGDSAHAGTASDHNPNSAGVVCAADFTHDPNSGVDIDSLTDHLVHPDNRHQCLKYVIANQLIAGIHTNWNWWTYYGSNPHTKHMHVSVGRGPDGQSTGPYDDTSPWGVATPSTQKGTPPLIGLSKGNEGEAVKGLQALLRYSGHSPGDVDGVYGPKTSDAVLAARKSVGSGVSSGDTVTGWAYAQIQWALIKEKGEGTPGPRGPAGQDGRDGKTPTKIAISGDVIATE